MARHVSLKTLMLALVVAVASSAYGGTGRPSTVQIRSQASDGPLVFATGISVLRDSQKAGAQAARMARRRLGAVTAKLVLVFDHTADRRRLCNGVAEVFDRGTIYGCSAYGPITEDGNEATVGVLAIGGKINADIVLAHLDAGHKATGQAIGRALKKVSADPEQGRVLLLIGKCHVPANHELVGGVQSVLGQRFPIVGGAASDGELVYFQGQVHRKANLGILLTGDFTCGFSTQGARQKGQILATSQAAVREAMGQASDGTAVVFAFNCGGRRGVLGDALAQEMEAIRQPLGASPLFGFYGSGEIGPPSNGKAARGVGFHIAVCALRRGAGAEP